MNSATLPIRFEVTYTSELIERAAKSFVNHLFRHQGRWLLAACVVNALGFGAVLWLGARNDLPTAFVGFLAVAGPLYCTYLFALFPRLYASRVSHFLVPSAFVSLNASAIEISTKGRDVRVPWSSVKRVVTCPAYFLLVISPLGVVFLILPRANIPPEADEVLAQRARRHVA